MQAAPDQVHQQEREVVEHVDGGETGVEFDGVEQRRPAVDQDNIAEMQVAVAAPHQAGALARLEQRRDARERGPGGGGQGGNRIPIEQVRHRAQLVVVLRHDRGQRRDEAGVLARLRAFMRRRHRAPEGVGEAVVDAAGVGQMIERLGLVEAGHLDRPFHRLAVAADGEGAAAGARDRHDPLVDRRRERPVDLDLGLAGGLALFERGIVEKGECHRALDLEGAPAAQKHSRRMGVDPPHRLAAFGAAEEVQHRLLRRIGLGHLAPGLPCRRQHRRATEGPG